MLGVNLRHHTKDKGDIGLACVMADLLRHDIQVALPISEHLPFDLIAIDPRGAMAKVSVKYRVMLKRGAVTVQTRSSWNDRHGTHHRHHDPGHSTDECYYLLASELSPSGRTLRITSPGNNQVTGVCLANLFTDPCRLFDPVSQLGEEQVDFQTGAVSAVANLSSAAGAGHCNSFDTRPGQESNPQSAI